MVDGPAAGKSTRIVYSGAGQGTLHVMAFGKSSPDGTNPALPQSGNRFLINGREFTGNRNTGHEFSDRWRPGRRRSEQPEGVIGPLLTDDNRMALIEFLKTQ